MRTTWTWAAMVAVLAALAAGCDDAGGDGDGGMGAPDARADSDAGRDDGGPGDDAAVEDGGGAGDGGATDAGLAEETSIALPADGAEVIHSVAARVATPDSAARVVVSVVEDPTLECESDTATFECLLDVTALDPGAFTLRAISYDAADAELGRDEITLTRREVPDPCAGMSGDRIDCALARAAAGTSAGFDGVSYLNYDDTHARANTSRMTGIDAQVHAAVPTTPPSGVVLGIANESRACRPTGGWLSRPRCDSIGKALGHHAANVFVFWPEHRDHGTRDYFQWQAPFYDLSQGSSGSELDEVVKMLTALAMIEPAARAEMVSATTVAPTVAMLLRRSRVPTDADYLTPEAFVTALVNADNGDALMALAAALRAGELPPVARVEAMAETFPGDWSMGRALNSDYAIGWAPASTPTDAPAGSFEVVLDLGSSSDPAGRPLVFFPALLRGDPAEVTIERANPEGTRWRVSGSFPAERTIATGGHDRTVHRVTVGFFAHNGLWLGAPALVSIGGRPSSEPAPDSNNLD